MGCCGQKRQAWREREAFEAQRRPAIARPLSTPPPALQSPRLLRHMGASSFMVKGAVTGRVYLFAGGGAGLAVDERDVPVLLKMAIFARGD